VKAPLSWLTDHVTLPAGTTAEAVAHAIASVGFEVASIDDDVIDFEITANRPDCLSIRGLAREAGTKCRSAEVPKYVGHPFRGAGPEHEAHPFTGAGPEYVGHPFRGAGPEYVGHPFRGAVIESPLCARFAVAMVDVTVGPSPQWLADRLTACGVRPINNVVDVTNYVMLEMGQPMHAYDAALVTGGRLIARLAHAGEKVRTLDNVERTLDGSMLVIADDSGAIGIAGVMGGATTEVSLSTRRIALESAWFQPATVRATSKRLGLKTEASTRFERGADIGAQVEAIDRAIALLEQIGAGRRASATSDLYPSPVARAPIALRRDRITRLLGDHVPDADVERTLTSLGFTLGATPDGWSVQAPTWRVDIAREADLIEEVGRHWGVNNIPASFPSLRATPRPSDAGVHRARRLRRILCGAGLQEAVTFTFIEEAAAQPFATPGVALVAIANPLSEKFSVLRPSILPGLLDAVAYNRRRGIEDVRLFEAGAVFSAAGEAQQIGWALCGARDAHWSLKAEGVDLFDALGIADTLGDGWKLQLSAEPVVGRITWAVPGRTARLRLKETIAGQAQVRTVGIVGQVRPDVAHARGVPQGVTVVAGTLDLLALTGDGGAPQKVAPLPKYPSVVRDLALLVDAGLPAAALRATIRAQAPATLVSVHEFDRYQGKGIPDGQVSVAVRLVFRDADRTLTDGEVQGAVDIITAALRGHHGATVRGAQ
jgi:phenylalanyl-tRNA synthetase beta chain